MVIGGLAQLVCQFPALMAVGYRFAADFQWRDPGVRQILRLMGPAVISSSVVQINVVVNSMFAYRVGEGAVSWLSYAFRLMQLPIGVFGVAVATVTLPALSRAAIGRDLRRISGRRWPRDCGWWPSWCCPPPSGWCSSRSRSSACFTSAELSRDQTGCRRRGALRAYGYGLVFYAWLKVLQPAFYAIDKRWFPMMVSFLALGLNLGFNYLFVFVMKWGHESLALTTSITASVNFLLLYLAMRKFAGDLETGGLLVVVRKTVGRGSGDGRRLPGGEPVSFPRPGRRRGLC